MGRAYGRELATLCDSLEWATRIDIEPVEKFVAAAHRLPLLAVGSGGSMAAAHFGALLHRHYGDGTSRHATPLEALLDEPHIGRSAVLILSASGRNRDVLAAARAAIEGEAQVLGSISTRSRSPLAEYVGTYCHGFAFTQQSPTGKDGFLATNSLLATLAILARGYGVESIPIGVTPTFPAVEKTAGRGSAIVLHAGWSSPAATDLESRLHESTLLNVQVSDYRNFGHGRHLWLSRRGDESVVLALITPQTASLAERTLELVPNDIPVLRFETNTDGPWGCIDLLLMVLHWTGALGELCSLDPGRPHVPDFGRRLFHVRPPVGASHKATPPVLRKLERIGSVHGASRLVYEEALLEFERALSLAEIGAVALDYDGTMCATCDRFNPLPEEMAAACIRLFRMGVRIGVATGRGKSVREALRGALPSEFWPLVLIGYYNGSDLALLTSGDAPDKRLPLDDAIAALRRRLASDPLITALAEMEVRPSQITVSPRPGAPTADLHAYLLECLDGDPATVRIVRSGHSIDLVAAEASKLRVVARLSSEIAPRSVLCIGDRGAWPGNDSHLLSHEFSLSVDQVSASLTSCWNLAPAGELGPSATIRYLNALTERQGSVRISLDQIRKASL